MNLIKIKKRIRKSLNNNISLRIYALILSIIVWFFVSATVYPNIPMYIKDVEINVDLEGTSAERNGLSLVSQDSQNVTVQIEGDRTVIGNLKSNDLVAIPIVTNITTPGKYQLTLEVKSLSDKKFNVISIRPSTINVVLDEIITKEFVIEAEAPNAIVEEGFYKDTVIASPDTVNITGPEQQIDSITRCVVRTDYGKDTEKLSESYEVTSGNQLILYNNNTVLNTDDFQFDKSIFSIKIPVYMRKALNFKLNFSNVPSGFSVDDLKYSLDTPQIEIAAPNDSIQNMTELHLGDVDLREIDIGSVFSFPVSLPEGYINLSGVQNVTATFAGEGFAKKKINIPGSSFSIINAPAQYNISVVTNGFSGVTFIGPEDVIEKLTVQDVVAQIDLLSVDIQGNDYYPAAISFYVPNKGSVWALGKHTVTVNAKEK